MKRKPKRFLDELTWPEVYAVIEKAAVAFFPIGTQEGHGRELPMGTDTYIAAAAALLASRKTGGIVLHPLAYSFTGATNAYRGTVSIPMHVQMEVIKSVIRNLWEQKFRAIVVVNVHAPNNIPALMAIRELFEYEKTVAAYFNPATVIDLAKYKCDNEYVEAAMCCSAMEVFGLQDFIPDQKKVTTENGPPLKLPGLKGLATGCHYTHIHQHMPPRKVKIEDGRKMMKEAAEKLVATVKGLEEYSRFIAKGGNPPFSVKP